MPRPSAPDPVAVHRAWLGLLQPDGIVASTAALVDAGLAPDPLAYGERDRLRALCGLAPVADAHRPARDPASASELSRGHTRSSRRRCDTVSCR
jgi:hypothetical protein